MVSPAGAARRAPAIRVAGSGATRVSSPPPPARGRRRTPAPAAAQLSHLARV